MNYDLPTSIEIDGAEYPIRTDFRAALDIMEALQDPELDDSERLLAGMSIFYGVDCVPDDLQEAAAALYWFLDGGQDRGNDKAGPRLVDWEHDWERIIAPVNRVLGFDARTVKQDPDTGAGLHWWTFLAAYMEIGGDCLLSQVVQIREKIKRGKRLDKSEREWYRRNRSLVDLPTSYTDAEKEIERQWTKG